MACRAPSTRPQRSPMRVAHGLDVGGVGDVELEHVGLGRELAGRALGERQPAAGAGEEHLRPLLLGQPGDAEGEGGVGEHAGDEDALAVEEGHGARDCHRPGGRYPRAGRLRMRGRGRAATVSPMRIGILGGTGPAGGALAARLASVGFETVVGLAVEVPGDGGRRQRSKASGPTASCTIDAGRQRRRGRRRPRRHRHAVGRRRPDRPVGGGRSSGARSSSPWPTPSPASARSSSRSSRPAGSVAASIQAVLRHSYVAAALHHVPAKELGDLDHPIESDVLICSDFPAATEATTRPRRQDPEHAARSTAASCRWPRRSSRSPRCCCSSTCATRRGSR